MAASRKPACAPPSDWARHTLRWRKPGTRPIARHPTPKRCSTRFRTNCMAIPARDIYKTEQEFTAGWIALRFLKDPATAAQHFARIGVGSVNPTALARGGYWQGRAAEAAGRSQDARAAYTGAAEQSTSYYGQLARAKLGLPQIELNGAPAARGRAIERLEIVRAVQLLYGLDEREIAIPI